MSFDNENSPGTTLTSGSTVTPTITTETVQTDNISMGGVSVKGITHDHSENTNTKLVTSYALRNAVYDIDREIGEVQQDLNELTFSSVLSEPIVNPFFVDRNWAFDGFYIDTSSLVYINKKPLGLDQAKAEIRSDAFNVTGTHFLYMTVSAIPSGKLTVTNEKNQILKEITTPGVYAFELTVDQPTIALLDFTVHNMAPNDTCIISNVFVHAVRVAFERYMQYMAAQMVSGGAGFATPDYVQQVAAQTLNESRTYTNTTLANFGGDIEDHLNSTDNPHQVNANQAGAAAIHHTHIPSECGSAPEVHLHIPADIGAADRVHTHTPSECGAAPEHHTHIPTDCGAAPTIHQHVLTDISDIQTVWNEFSLVDAEIQNVRSEITTSNEAFDAHLVDNDNPHTTTAAQVGLGNVINAPMATVQEVIDGTTQAAYVNPYTCKEAILSALGGTNTETIALSPKKLRTISWVYTADDVSVPIKKDRIYQILIDFGNSEDLRNIGISVNEKGGNSTIRNNIMSTKSLTIDTTTIDVVGWDKSTDDHFKLMLPSMGINSATGMLTLDTSSMTLTGIMHGRILEDTTELLPYAFPYTVASSYALGAVPNEINELIFHSIDGNPLYGIIQIFELLQTTQEPALVIDATPVGFIASRLTDDVVPGWIRFDGSELSRVNYPELFVHIENSGIAVSDSVWNEEFNTLGYCDKFSLGDGSTTFRVPKDQTGSVYRYIKAKYTQIPDGNELLYRFVWEN